MAIEGERGGKENVGGGRGMGDDDGVREKEGGKGRREERG